MSNSHGMPSQMAETQSICGDLLPSCVISETWPSASGSMTLAPFATFAYVRGGSPTRLVYVNQPAAPVTLSGADGNFWIAIHADTHSPVAGWTRAIGTSYLWRSSATQPVDPPHGLVFSKCTVAGSVVNAVDVVLHSYPRNRIPYGGATGALAYDPELSYDPAINRLRAPQFLAENSSGDNVWGFYSGVNASGGTNRYAFIAAGNAPSSFGGSLTAAATLHWNSYATGIQLRLGDHTAPGYTLDVSGNTRLSPHAGIGVNPAPGVYNLNCGSANFSSVNTPSLTATTATTSTLITYRLGLSNGDPGTTYALYSAGGMHRFEGPLRATGVGIGADPGGWALYSPGGGHVYINGCVGIGAGTELGYWLRTPSIYVDTLRATTASVDANLGVGGNVTVTGNVYATIGAFGVGAQGGYYLSAANFYCGNASITGTLGVTGVLTTVTNVQLGGDLFVSNRIGVGVSPVAGMHITLGGTGASKPGGGAWMDSSSRTMKRNIQRIPNALPLLLEQRGCVYEWEEATRAALLPGPRYGLVAEEVTLPQWRTEQEDGTVAIAANGFEALAIESFRTIVTMVEGIQQRLDALETH